MASPVHFWSNLWLVMLNAKWTSDGCTIRDKWWMLMLCSRRVEYRLHKLWWRSRWRVSFHLRSSQKAKTLLVFFCGKHQAVLVTFIAMSNRSVEVSWAGRGHLAGRSQWESSYVQVQSEREKSNSKWRPMGEVIAIAAYLDSNDGVIYDYVLILSVAPAGRSDLTHAPLLCNARSALLVYCWICFLPVIKYSDDTSYSRCISSFA